MDSSYNKISLLVYFVSFFFPVFSNADEKGFIAFLCVPFFFEEPVLLICWSANIVFAIALIAPAGSWKKFFFSFTAVSFSFGLVAYKYIPGSGFSLLKKETPEQAFYGTGYILWISAFMITLIGSVIDIRADNKNAARGSHGIV